MGFWGKFGKILGGVGMGAVGAMTGQPELIGAGVQMGASAFGGSPGDLTKEQQAQQSQLTQLAGRQSGLSDVLQRQSAQQYKLGQPAYQQGLSYYQKLLSGDRAAQAQAVAPQVANIQDIYGGAQRNLERQGIRGGEAQMALADIGRQRARDISGLTVGVQPMAAQQVSQLGAQGMSEALQRQQAASGALGMSSNIYQSLMPGAQQRAQLGYQASSETGQSIAKMLTPMLQRWAGGKTQDSGGEGSSEGSGEGTGK